MNKLENSLMCGAACAVLFFALSPGVLITIPPKCPNKIFMNIKKDNGCSTSYESAAVHSVIFWLVASLICYLMK